MLRKMKLVVMTALLIVSLVGCSKPLEVELPSETSQVIKSGFGENHKKYLIEDNPNVCLYTLDEDSVYLLITANTDDEQVECYSHAFTRKIGGTPIAVAADLHSVIIENDDGKFEVTCDFRGIQGTEGPSEVTEFRQEDSSKEFINLIIE